MGIITTRKINQIIEPQNVIEGAGVRLRRSFGPSRLNPFDPFLLFDHFAFNDPIEGPIRGFPYHPHRGIETVTYMLEGNVSHRDSLGNAGVIGPGDVQWMTSGRGILHEEMPRRGPNGVINGFQLWVNLPAAQKMDAPRYQELTADQVPVIEADGAIVRLVAGEYAGQRGPVTEIAIQPLYMDVTLSAGATFELPTPGEHAVYAYVFEGAGEFGSQEDAGQVEAVKFLEFGAGAMLRASSTDGLRFILFAGQPIREAIVPYGPFVMNTEEEIHQVFEDIKNGSFAQPF
jgi:redox-sensitive bicupin YhaK (pirin superfamily)